MKSTRETKHARRDLAPAEAAPTGARRTEEMTKQLSRCEDELIVAATRGQLVEGAIHRVPLGVIVCAAATLELAFVNQTARDCLAHHPAVPEILGGDFEGQSLSILDDVIELDRALLRDRRHLPLSRMTSTYRGARRREPARSAVCRARGRARHLSRGRCLVWPVASSGRLGGGSRA